MNHIDEKLQKCYESFLEKKINFKPEVALILGSGLGDYADELEVEAELSYGELEGFPRSTVQGHKGRFVFAHVKGVPTVIMQGRVHFYEGYEMQDVVLPIRLMKLMGARVLFLTNACGGVNFDFRAGDFMMITDQISCFVPSPLAGPNLDALGPRFCDMSEVYDKDLRAVLRSSADRLGISLKEGTYLQFPGPQFETPAEIRMFRGLGADAVGMSTACEAIAANHMGMKICGISCITNLACGMTENRLSHEEVQETADRVAPLFKQLVTESIAEIGKLPG